MMSPTGFPDDCDPVFMATILIQRRDASRIGSASLASIFWLT
jgi:hypothetical protein